ncbi:hypothetical protein [Tumebacillus permanentifrigoris]|uniref:Uncharacterized protein n=1 Tax=Tumebacillus permanentifrigoris TaxID=378543 RepID=A0A316DCX0_9BACL|nr:hypothetical protein [Tumebacillus permanentifrigoris]PWK15578.1 hypothetical protein C7459_103115 [Tumebacillus permanentifrigoris]
MKKLILACLLVALSGAGYTLYTHQPEAAPKQDLTATESPALEKTPDATPQQPTATTPTPDITTVVQEADFIKYYNSFEELVDTSEIAVEGKALETEPYDFHPSDSPTRTVAMTKVKVQVKKSFNDLVKKGDVITVVEMGGITTKKALGFDQKFDLPPDQLNEKVQVLFDGLPVMAPNDEVLLFASATKMVTCPNNEPYYSITGVHQGKFKLKNDTFSRDVPKNQESAFKSLQSKTADAETKIQERMKTKLK